MKIGVGLVVVCVVGLCFSSLSIGADSKAMVEDIFETKELIERAVRGGKWDAAGQGVTKLEKQMHELVAKMKIDKAAETRQKISLIAKGMHDAIAEKEDEEYEEPAHAMASQLLKLMDHMDYGKPAVFIIMQRQVEESLELVEEGHWESLEEEMEEIVNVRSEARRSAKQSNINPDKVDAILDLAWDISRDADEKNRASATGRLKRMKSILESI